MREKSRRITPGVRGLWAPQQLPTAWILCTLAIAPACSQGPASHTLDGSRVVESAQVDFGKTSTTAERFGLAKSSGSPSAHGTPSTATPKPTASGLAWTTPPGWKEKPASSMRVANFEPAEGTECYLTMLSGDAGGLAANVNRWRTQLSLGPMSAKDLEQLPRSSMLGGDAVLVDFTGTWKGMSGTDGKEHWRLLGLLLVDPNGSAFLKMTGPDAAVAAQRDAMCALARSFRPAGSSEPVDSGVDATNTDATMGTSTTPTAGATLENAAGFAFTMPSGWRRAPDRPARAFTLFAGAGEGLECYVTSLTGDAGGALANVNRWRGQLGLTSITQTDLSALPSTKVMGRDAVLVECDGTSASLLGAACNGSDRSVFVKMTGPRDLVRAQRTAFLAFCNSLQEAK